MKKNTTKFKQGFTIIELMVVVVIVGLMAAFAIPNYQKSIRKSNQKNAKRQLELLHSSLSLYYAENDEFLPGTNLNISDLNAALNISINSSDLAFDYNRVAASTEEYDVSATYSEGATNIFIMTLNEQTLEPTNPCCTTSACSLVSICP